MFQALIVAHFQKWVPPIICVSLLDVGLGSGFEFAVLKTTTIIIAIIIFGVTPVSP